MEGATLSHSAELDQLAAALAKAQGEFIAIPKDSNNPFFKSKYAALPQVVEVASPIISKNGLSVSQFLGTTDSSDTLTTWLLHSSGQYICQTMKLHLVKNDPQGQGSATTYARRYSYMAVLGLVADEDDDGNAASRPQAKSAATQAPRASTTKPASDKQLDLLRSLMQKLGINEDAIKARLALIETSAEASDAIEKTQAKLDTKEAE